MLNCAEKNLRKVNHDITRDNCNAIESSWSFVGTLKGSATPLCSTKSSSWSLCAAVKRKPFQGRPISYSCVKLVPPEERGTSQVWLFTWETRLLISIPPSGTCGWTWNRTVVWYSWTRVLLATNGIFIFPI